MNLAVFAALMIKLVCHCLFLVIVSAKGSQPARSLGMPNLESSDQVHFYYLRSDVAYNIDVSNVTDSMHGGYETHAGIGVWDLNSDMKFSIELVPVSGIGAIFFPIVDTSNGSHVEFEWKNVGQVHITQPIDERWNSEQFITSTNGDAFNKWAGIIQDMVKENNNAALIIQPFSIVEYTQNIENTFFDDRKTSLGNVLVQGTDSFSFTITSLNVLGQMGCSLTTFQRPQVTNLGYFTPASTIDELSVVDLSLAGSKRETRLQVAEWYSALEKCAEENISPANGIVHFVRLISVNCLTGYAYVYKNDSSVYNVSLSASKYHAFTTETTVQLQKRVIIDLLNPFSVVDTVTYSIVFFLLVSVVGFFMFGKIHKKRRRVSFEGELLAREAVIQNILLESDKSRDQIIDYFYREKKRDAWTFQRWLHRILTGEGDLEDDKPIFRQSRYDSGSIWRMSRGSAMSESTWNSTKKDTPSGIFMDPRYTEGGQVKALDREQIKKLAARRERYEQRSRASITSVASSVASTQRSEIGMTVINKASNPIIHDSAEGYNQTEEANGAAEADKSAGGMERDATSDRRFEQKKNKEGADDDHIPREEP